MIIKWTWYSRCKEEEIWRKVVCGHESPTCRLALWMFDGPRDWRQYFRSFGDVQRIIGQVCSSWQRDYAKVCGAIQTISWSACCQKNVQDCEERTLIRTGQRWQLMIVFLSQTPSRPPPQKKKPRALELWYIMSATHNLNFILRYSASVSFIMKCRQTLQRPQSKNLMFSVIISLEE